MEQKTKPDIRTQIRISEHIYPNLYAMLEDTPPSQRNAKIMWILSLFDSPVSAANSFNRESPKGEANLNIEPTSQNEDPLESTPEEEPAIAVEISTTSEAEDQTSEDAYEEPVVNDKTSIDQMIAEDFKDY